MSQIFKKSPPIEILNKLLTTIGINEFKEAYSFTKKNLIQFNTIQKIEQIKPDLYPYYYPCKAKIYLENLTENKVITILRQFLRVFDYHLISKEKYTFGDKYLIYVLEKNQPIIINKKTTLFFD